MAYFPSMPDADMKDTLARDSATGIPCSAGGKIWYNTPAAPWSAIGSPMPV